MSRIAATLLRILVVLAILRILASRPVIDFLEQLVVLFYERVVWLQFERFFVRRTGLFEVSLVFVGDAEVVEGFCVLGIDLHRAFPAVDRFAPEAALRDRDAEFDL